jgi:FKBP-type peptidyl-prolyl cis-trans isomerase SlyD
MKITTHAKVRIDYTLKNDDGEVLDTSEGREPLAFLQGAGQIITGLEQALEGREAGDRFSVSIEPALGYGEYDDDLVFEVPRERFGGEGEIAEGVQVQAEMQDGSVSVLTIVDIADDLVTLDANHPLAGETLHFDVEVAEVSEATAEEIEHGHVHDGHSHGEHDH